MDHVTPIKIFGDKYDVEARVHTINALSAHADRKELLDYYTEMGPGVERAFVVHGEEAHALAFADALRELGAKDVVVPDPGQTVEV